MTVTIRGTDNLETSKTIIVSANSTGSLGGYTVACSSITGASVNECNNCFHATMDTNTSRATNIFIPRTGINS